MAHDVGGVVQARNGHNWPSAIPVDVVSNQWYVETEGEPLSSKQEHDVEDDVESILWQHQRIQTITLVNGVLVVCLQFIKRDDVENSEKDQKCINNECTNV